MPVTIKDVAERVGRSITTVSRALNDYDDVSAETRRLIKQTALEMGYVPSSIAQKLQKQRADIIGIVLPTFGPRFSDPFFSEFIAGIGNTAANYGFDLLVSTRPPGDKELDTYLEKIKSRQVDGFVVVRTRRNDPRINLLRQHNIPFSVFGRIETGNDFNLVDEDSELGMQMMVNHLINMGHRRIGFIAAPADLMFAHYRTQAFKAALAAHELKLDDACLIESDLTQRGGREAARKLLQLSKPPTAIVACNDLMGIGAISAAQELGLQVGYDVAITGFDDIPAAEHAHPPLTTIHQPIYQIGGMLAKMLIDTINNTQVETKQIILQPALVLRGSSGGDTLERW